MTVHNPERVATPGARLPLIAAICSIVGILGILSGLVLVAFAVYRMSPSTAFLGIGVLVASLAIHAIGVYLRFRSGSGRRFSRRH